MSYIVITKEIQSKEMQTNVFSWSPRTYGHLEIGTPNAKKVKELLKDEGYEKGVEVGSLAYVPDSNYKFIRTKALQPQKNLTQNEKGSVISITPKAFAKATQDGKGLALDGDILYARGGNVGEVALVYDCGQATFSSHILKLKFSNYSIYCFAFLKHPICKLQQQPKVKGSIRSLDNFNINTLFECKIPFPNQENAECVIKYVSALTQAIIDKEKAIRQKYWKIITTIRQELTNNQNQNSFSYSFPTRQLLLSVGRLDSSFWSEELAETLFPIRNYANGSTSSIFKLRPPFEIRRGPNLAVSVSGKARYFDVPTGNAYKLASPSDITDYMTISTFRYYGNVRKMDTVKEGEVIFAAKGMREVSIGHTYVHLSGGDFLTNYDAFILDSGNKNLNIFLACFLNYCKVNRVFAYLSDTSNGGSFIENHFNYLPIPNFPDDVQEKIVKLYHNRIPPPNNMLTLTNFVEWHREWNNNLGLWEIDHEMKKLHQKLSEVQQKIIAGIRVDLPFLE